MCKYVMIRENADDEVNSVQNLLQWRNAHMGEKSQITCDCCDAENDDYVLQYKKKSR